MKVIDNEKELIMAAKLGDLKARNTLFNQYTNLAKGIWGVEELGQAFITFAGIIERFDMALYKRPTAFFSFLKASWTMAQRSSFNESIKQENPIDTAIVPESAFYLNRPKESYVERLAELKELGELPKLPARAKQFFDLFRAGFAIEDIEERMGLPERARFFIARQIVKGAKLCRKRMKIA